MKMPIIEKELKNPAVIHRMELVLEAKAELRRIGMRGIIQGEKIVSIPAKNVLNILLTRGVCFSLGILLAHLFR